MRSEVVLMGSGLGVRSEVFKGKEGVFVMEVISGRVVAAVFFWWGCFRLLFPYCFYFSSGYGRLGSVVYPILCYPFLGLGGVVRFGDDDDLESVVGLNDAYVECDIMVDVVR